jgi:catechol 2,3-dioxygenase-like lactoylglutathione lyase family enzyme
VTGVHHLTLRVRDLAASARFYEEALGIPVLRLGDRSRLLVGDTIVVLREPLPGTPATIGSARPGSALTTSRSGSRRRQSLRSSRSGSASWARRSESPSTTRTAAGSDWPFATPTTSSWSSTQAHDSRIN